MTQIFEGSIQTSLGYQSSDLDNIKKQIDKLLVDSGVTPSPVEIEKVINRNIRNAMILGVTNAGIWVAATASLIAPIETGRLRASGSVWVNGERVFITGGGTHPDSIDTPELTAIIIFNAPYAFIQDSRIDFNHPNGGQAGYLTDTMNRTEMIKEIMIAPLKTILGQ